jgi:hypothetical protein
MSTLVSVARRRRRAPAQAIAILSAFVVVGIAACGGGNDAALSVTAVGDAAVDRSSAEPRVPSDASTPEASIPDVVVEAAPVMDAAACNVRLESPPLMTTVHIPLGAPVVYNSNPPSSGPHYTTWANFQEFTQPVDDRYLVHSMEHGAVLLLYKCEDAGCPELVDALRALRDAIPTDPLCDPSIRVRVVLAPRPANDATVAAAAWGATYRADCFDGPSLTQFVIAHYAMGPENFCDPGQTF